MSSYLLLRNNKESGPFTIEEIKGLSLKAYDLLWVVGKSAAWRYPGEIPELKSFAPPVPEDVLTPFIKKSASAQNAEFSAIKKPESARTKDNSPKKVVSGGSVYINLPADKKQVVIVPDRVLFETDAPPAIIHEPAYDFSDLYKKKTSRAARFSGKILWISTIILLFGTGILTGLFISDRRKFFPVNEEHSLPVPAFQHSALNSQKPNSPVAGESRSDDQSFVKTDSAKSALAAAKKTSAARRGSKNESIKKDSAVSQVYALTNLIKDSVKPYSVNKTELLFQKIKAHPEDFINLETGRYSTGMFGGISSFPVTVTNNSSLVLDQVLISIDYIQNNEKVFKTESLSFNDLQPGEAVTIKAPKSPRGMKIAARIHGVSTRQPDLNNAN
jgi:hypothetical protein